MTAQGAAPQPTDAPAGDFEPRLFADELRRRSVRGGMTLVLAQGGGHVIRLLMTLVLARLLTPGDFGRVAMVAAVIGIAQVFLDLGLSVVTAQRPHLTSQQASTLFWFNTAFGGIVATLCALAAPLIARFYDDPQTVSITLALAGGFFLNGLATQHRALMRRMLQFTRLAKLNFLSVACSATVALVVAFEGGGFWALVAYALTDDLVSGVLAWRYCRWRPGPPQLDRETLNMLSHGGHVTAFSLMGYLSRNLHNVLIGRLFGNAAVGLYGRAIGLVNVLQSYAGSAIEAVALPALSQLRGDPAQFRSYYLKALRTAMLPAAPLACFASAWSSPIVEVLFGPQWTATATLLQILSLSLLAQPVLYSSGWLFLARGRSREMMRWGFIGWGFLIASLIAGSQLGLAGLATSYTAAFIALVVPGMVYATQGTTLTLWDVLRSWAPATSSAATATVVTLLAEPALPWTVPVVHLILVGAIFGACYLTLLSTVFRQWPLIAEILSHLQLRRGQAS